MEPQRKKSRVSSDPLSILCSDVFENIFQHFKNDDVLATSMVSPSWFRITEASAKCAEKLHLKVVVPYTNPYFQVIDDDLRSRRKYQNIFLHNFSCIVPEIVKVLTGRCWKKVFISTRNLKRRSDFYDIVELIEDQVEDLSISLTSLHNNDEISEKIKLKFPNLKNLELTRSYGLLVEEISDDCTNLKILKLDLDPSSWRKHQKFVEKILANNDQLEKLTLWRCSAKTVFQLESIKKFRFKLKTFLFKNCVDGIPSNEEENCLFDFLESQANFLETLKLEEWFGIQVLKLIFKMPKLCEFTIDFYDVEKTIDWDSVSFNQSSSIRKFHLDSYRNSRSKIKLFNALFESMPNLRILVFDNLDNDSLNAIGPRCQKLEELEIQDLRTQHVSSPLFFPNIQRLHCEDRINQKTKQRIHMKPKERRTPFEQLLLRAKPYFVTK